MVEVMKVMATSFKRSHAHTAALSAPNPAAGHHRPMPLPETPGHSWASLHQSLVGSLLLSPGSCAYKVLFVLPDVQAEFRKGRGTRDQIANICGSLRKQENSRKTSTSASWGFPGGSEDKASACNAGDPGLIPGLGRSPREGNGNSP